MAETLKDVAIDLPASGRGSFAALQAHLGALIAHLDPAERVVWQEELARWPASLIAEATRVCAVQPPQVAHAALAAARRLVTYRAEAAAHLLAALGEPTVLSPDAVATLSNLLAGLPTALGRSFCQSLRQLAPVLSGDDLVRLADTFPRLPLSARGVPSAQLVLDAAARLAGREDLSTQVRRALVGLLLDVAPSDPAAVVAELHASADALARLEAGMHGPLLGVAQQLSGQSVASARAWLRQASSCLAGIAAGQRLACLAATAACAVQHPDAPLALAQSSAAVLRDYGQCGWEAWVAAGRELDGYVALAHFRRQSRRSLRVLRATTQHLALEDVRNVLARYCAALAGHQVELCSDGDDRAAALRSAGHVSSAPRVFLPPSVPRCPGQPPPFAYYKVTATHQTGHFEFGTYTFALDRPGRRLPTLRPAGRSGGLEALFRLFPNPVLAHAIFVTLEDTRVDARAVAQYAGLAPDYRRLQRAERRARPPVGALAPRAALLEALVRLSLGGTCRGLPPPLAAGVVWLRRAVRVLVHPQATVEDVAEATLRLYPLFAALPAVAPEEFAVELLHPDEVPAELAAAMPGPHGADPSDAVLSLPSYRAHDDPILNEALARARAADHGEGTPLTPDELRRLLQRGLRDIDLAEGDASADQGLFVTDLVNKPPVRLQARKSVRASDDEPAPRPRAERPGVARRFVYDEWDFRARDYRPRWCQLFERPIEEGPEDFVLATLRAHPGVAAAIRRRLLQLRPHQLAKRRGLLEGEDLDLDAAIERVIGLRMRGHTTDRVYWQRQRLERDVAVAFLLDMSASTDAEVSTANGLRHIIDVEKEGLVLLSAALESVGDRYGIYGFSGYGRENVEFYVIKELEERFSPTIARRIAGVRPLRSTRMGPAIRHATSKLQRSGARLRLLLLLSDGYPQDYDYYGVDRLERDYALHDTRVALLEARSRGIVPFCLTVDQAGYDYLRTMCEGLGYEVVRELAALPERLAALYTFLTH